MFFTRDIFVFCSLAGVLATSASALVGPSGDGGAYAAHALMVLSSGAGRAGFCTGAVIGQKLVLTAAHCVSSPGATRVHFRDASGAPVLMNVTRVAKNPLYRADAVAARVKSVDLALVETQDPLPASFAPAALGGGPEDVGATVDVAGFGLTREGVASSSGTLRSARLALRAPLSNVLLWLEGAEGAGACTGDSGAPVFWNGAIAGIVAYAQAPHGRGCGGLTQAVRVGPQRVWIESLIAGWR